MKYDICVLGGCSLDRMFYQNIDGTYSSVPDSEVPGGKGANQAIAAARAGGSVAIISRLGNDSIGKTILDNLAYNGVDTSYVELVDGLSNDVSNIYINLKDKDNDIKRQFGAIDSFYADMIDKYSDVLLSSSIIVCQLKVPKDVTVRLINFCYENNKMLVLTPCRPEKLCVIDEDNINLLDKVSIITANKVECEKLFNTSDIESCIRKYPNKLIVTLGSSGLMYFDGNRIIKMPAINIDNVVDSTGAGDTLNGNLVYYLSTGLSLKHSLRKGMFASAMKIRKKGAQLGMPYKEELNNYILNVRSSKFKYKKELDLILKNIRNCYCLKNSVMEVMEKDDSTYATSLEIDIENYLVDLILKKFPGYNIVAEENYCSNELKDNTFIIDSIDGTNHYMKNNLFFATQLAFYDKDSVKFSVIYIPKLDQLYYSVKNNGSYVNNNRILVKKPNPLNMCIVEFCGSLYKNMNSKFKYLEKLIDSDTKRPLVLDFLYINSCSIAFTNLATGKTDALIISTKDIWDILPGELLCSELGIKIYDLDFDDNLKLYTANDNIRKLLLNK